MTRKTRWFVSTVLLALACGAALWIYLAPHRTVGRIHAALRQNDTNALAHDIDFPALQSSLKSQVTALVTNKMAADAGGQPVNPVAQAIALGVVKHLAAEYVTPAGLCKLLSGEAGLRKKEAGSTPADPAKLDRSFGEASHQYRGAGEFVVLLRSKPDETTELVLVRQGLRWQLRDIVLPAVR